MPSHHLNRFAALSLSAVLISSLPGCIGGSTEPSRFYMLEPIKAAGGAVPAGAGEKTVIALAPVRIPQYLDRPQIVTATAPNAYALNEFNRWAERLDDNIGRVLAQNLEMLVPAELVLANASARARQAGLRVSVGILEFHVDPQGRAGLAAQWTIMRGEEMLEGRQVDYHEPASSTTDYRALVAALNACLDRLSRDLAEALRPLAGRGG